MYSRRRMVAASRVVMSLIAVLLAAGCTVGRSGEGRGTAQRLDRQVAQSQQEMGFQGREIIRTARMRLEVDDPVTIGDEVTDLVKAAGGYVADRTDADRRSVLTLRVPSDDLDEVLDQLSDVGDEQERSITAKDVTEQLADTEASLENARALRDRLRLLLDRATKVEEILKIETELSRVQTQIDQMEGRLKRLRSQVALSSISVTLEKRRVLGPVGYVLQGTFWALRKLFVLSE